MIMRLKSTLNLNCRQPKDRLALALINLLAEVDHRTPTNMVRVVIEETCPPLLRAHGISDHAVRAAVAELAKPKLARRGRRAPKDGDAHGGASKSEQAAGAA